MSESETSLGNINNDIGIVDKIKKILCSKRGLYIIGAILLLGIIYYYTQSGKKSSSKGKKDSEEELTDIPEPPPGYVTVPVEMLQGLQQEQMYANNEQQIDNKIPLPPPPVENIPAEVPQLRHNRQIEDEEDEIAEQNLTKEEMDSIQAQLNAMHRESAN